MWPLKKIYISCTGPSCHNWFTDFLLVRQNSFTTAYPMNCQNKLVWQLGSVHKIHFHLEATSPFRQFNNYLKVFNSGKDIISLLRYIDNVKQSAHTDNLFNKYNILKLPDLTNFNMAVFMHKLVHKKHPPHLTISSQKHFFKDH